MLNSPLFAISLLLIFGIRIGGVSGGPSSSQLEYVDVQVPDLGTYRGAHIAESHIAPVLAWLGIDYVKQPIGDLRFRPPQKLDVYKRHSKHRIINATQYGLICPQAGLGAYWPMGEGCLSLNIYRTAGVPLEKKLPVALYIHGVSS